MAQVRKYQEGGSTTKKYGTFTIDGNKFEVDDDFLNQITNYGKSLDNKTAYQFSNIIDTLRSGENISYDSVDDRLDGNVQFEVSKNQDRRLKHRRNGIGRWFGGTFRGKEEAARNAIHALKDFTYNKPTPTGTNYDWSKALTIEYEKDKDGKYKLVDGKRVFINGANNLKILDRLAHLQDILNYGENDTFNGFGGLTKENYINLYNKWGKTEVERLQNAIKNGTISAKDLEAINDIGIELGKEPTDKEIEQARLASEDPKDKAEREAKDRYKKAGVNYEWGNIFGVDDNGKVTITDPTLKSYIGTGNVWLNNLFRNAHSEYADYIPEDTGLFVINGRVYNGSDQEALSKLPEYRKFVADNRQTAGNASNIKQYWGNTVSSWNSTSVDPEGNPIWSPYFQHGKFARDISGDYVRQSGDPLIYEYLENYNPNDTQQFDQFGHPLQSLAKRVYIDPVTKQVVDYTGKLQEQTSDDARRAYYDNTNKPTAFNPYYTIGNQGGYMQVANVGDRSNPYSGASVYYNPDNGLYYYYDENPGNDNLILNSVLPDEYDNMRDYYWNIDSRLGEYLREHPEALSNSEVKRLIGEIIRNPYLAAISGRKQGDFKSIWDSYPELYKLFEDLYQSQNLRYGNTTKTFSGQGGNQELRDIRTPEALESLGLAYRIPTNKKGGIIKYQIGGVSANRKNSFKASKETVKQSQTKLRKAGEDKVIGDGTDLTASDKAELAALIGDAASLGMTFVPVYGNVAGAGVGAASSLAGFYADATKDGLGWSDAGSLLVNLGLDAATLLPGIGTGAKAAKVAKALGKSDAVVKAVKWAAKALDATSYASIAMALSNIKTNNWTIKDIRTVLNGIRGFANIKRTTGSATTKDKIGDIVTLKSKSKDLPEVKLNRSEIESVQKSPKNERSDKLEELLISKLPKETKTDQVTDILSEYGIERSNTSNWSWRHPFTFSKSSIVNTNQFDYDIIPGTYRDPRKMSWWNWNRRAAIRNAKVNNENPYFRPLHWDTKKVEDLNLSHPITMPIYSNFVPYFSITPEIREYYNPSNPPIFYKKGGKVLKAQKGSQFGGESTKKPFFISPDTLLGAADFIASTVGINRSNQKMKDAIYKGMIGSQQQMPTEFYSRFSDNGLHRMYDDRIKKMRQYKTVTSDPNQVMTEKLMRDMNVDQMENERDTKFSQMIDQYNDKILAQKQQYANMRTQIVNENKNRWYQGLAQLDMTDANKIGQQTQNVKNLIYQLRGNYAKDLERRNQIEDKLNQINANVTSQNKLKALFNELGGFGAMSKEEKEQFGNDWQAFLAYKVPDRVASIQSEGFFDYHLGTANDPKRRYSFINWLGELNVPRVEIDSTPKAPTMKSEFHKKGGTIKRFRNVDEQAYLDQQKAINKAVNDLNNNIIKLFIKMMS